MQHSATNPHTVAPDISPLQSKIIIRLLAGESVSAASRSEGIDRSTVHRWLKDSLEFRAALNRGKREISDSVDAVVLLTAQEAAQTVRKAIQAGDVQASMGVLRGLGILAGIRMDIGPGHPSLLHEEDKRAAERERDEDFKRMLGLRK